MKISIDSLLFLFDRARIQEESSVIIQPEKDRTESAEQLCAQLIHNSTDENDRNKRPLFGTKSIAIPFSDNFPLPLAKSLVRSLKTLQPSPNSSVVVTF